MLVGVRQRAHPSPGEGLPPFWRLVSFSVYDPSKYNTMRLIYQRVSAVDCRERLRLGSHPAGFRADSLEMSKGDHFLVYNVGQFSIIFLRYEQKAIIFLLYNINRVHCHVIGQFSFHILFVLRFRSTKYEQT